MEIALKPEKQPTTRQVHYSWYSEERLPGLKSGQEGEWENFWRAGARLQGMSSYSQAGDTMAP